MLKGLTGTSLGIGVAIVFAGCAALGPDLHQTMGSAAAQGGGTPVNTVSFAQDTCWTAGLDLARQLGTIDEPIAMVGVTAGGVARWIVNRDGKDGPHPDNDRWLRRPADQRVAFCAYGGSGFAAPRPEGIAEYDYVLIIVPDGEVPLVDSFGHQKDGLALPTE